MEPSLLHKTPGCVAAAAVILGDKWTPMLIRALAEGTQRFSALQDKSGGVNPRTLSARLAKLEEQGVINRQVHLGSPTRIDYSLTQKGHDLMPILEQMAEWGEKYGPERKDS